MTVKDYYRDMVLHQKWGIEIDHYYESEEILEEDFETIHYSVPCEKRCPYWDFEVRFFRVVDDEIILCIADEIRKGAE